MKVHLIGIGGIGMSGLAKLLLTRGDRVSGSDAHENTLVQELRQMGGEIWIGHSAAHVDGAELVVYSSSIPPQNPELICARNRNIPVLHRGQLAAQLVSSLQTIAVTGSHGKSTTTAMAGHLLLQAGLDPTILLGAEVESLGGNARAGTGPYAVIEADESDGSLLWLEPFCALVTHVDQEHLDYFRNSGEILETYTAFTRRIAPQGFLIGCADYPLLHPVLRSSSCSTVTYGLSPQAEVTAQKIKIGPGESSYRCFCFGREVGTIRLKVPGRHNVTNSLGIVALAHVLKIDFRVVQSALQSYEGARRRFQIHGEVEGILVVEDYGHHPAEIRATLQAARSWPGRRIRCVFQPHRYSRTKFLLDQFRSSFDLADELILLPVYAASEEPIEGSTSEVLLQAIRSTGKNQVSLRSPEEVLTHLARDSAPGELILFLGAGDVGALAPRLVESLRARSRRKEEHATSSSPL